MNDRSINVPPWLKRLPSWCRNVDKEQLDYFTNGSEQFSDNDIIDDKNVSLVWDEAENRLHIQKAILEWCLHKI